MSPKTLFDKLWDSRVVHSVEKGPDVLYIDRHYILFAIGLLSQSAPVEALKIMNKSLKRVDDTIR